MFRLLYFLTQMVMQTVKPQRECGPYLQLKKSPKAYFNTWLLRGQIGYSVNEEHQEVD